MQIIHFVVNAVQKWTVSTMSKVFPSCSDCICRSCLYWWSLRCQCKSDTQLCRGGVFHPLRSCEKHVKYDGQTVKTCLKANVSVFQDGYISCSLIDNLGCERCMEEFERKGCM